MFNFSHFRDQRELRVAPIVIFLFLSVQRKRIPMLIDIEKATEAATSRMSKQTSERDLVLAMRKVSRLLTAKAKEVPEE
jgi:hypothetical protein